ncbi:MAG TPA: hypothetical protein VFE90_22860, partial [Myxococcales bacterium]|nr:hypothetical protein [Myxococcales bacterium]
TDAGTDGGVTTACASLVPRDAGTPFFVDLDTGDASQVCAAGRPDGTGTIPLRAGTFDANGIHRTTWSFVRAADGLQLSRLEYAPGTGPLTVLAQPQGFTGLEPVGSPATIDLHAFTAQGADLSVAHSSASAVLPDPAGGSVAFVLTRDRTSFSLRFHRYDAAGKLTVDSQAATGSAPDLGVSWVAGVALEGRTLLVYGATGMACHALWLDVRGSPVSAVFEPSICDIRQLRPLLDGSLAVEGLDRDRNPTIAGVIAPLGTRVSAAPAWLLGMRELFLLPAGRGYALRRQGTSRPLELISPEGETCGALTTPEMGNGPLSVGRDGTLVEQDLTGTGCTFRFYPQLFR